MTCGEVKLLLTQSAYENVGKEEAVGLEKHLSQCHSCRTEQEELRKFIRRLPKDVPALPEDFFVNQRAAVMGRLSAGKADGGWEMPAWGRRWGWAPLLAGAGALAFWVARPVKPPVFEGLDVVQNIDMLNHLDLLEDWVEMDSHGQA